MILYWNSKRAILQVAKREKIILCLKMCKNALIKKFVMYWKYMFYANCYCRVGRN